MMSNLEGNSSGNQAGFVPVKRALISVFYKDGLIDVCRALSQAKVELFATDGTAKFLAPEGISCSKIEALTQFPEMMDGRVKTLHPRVFGGLLARRSVPKDLEEAQAHGIPLFDLVVGNLYPFAEHLGEPTFQQSAFVDIGGPSLLRAAAKNHISVCVLSHPSEYESFLGEFRESGGTTLAFRKGAACRTFSRTSAYDAMIASEWGGAFPASLALSPQTPLRYGENPHQQGAWCGTPKWKALQGKELSYNNLLDAEAAWDHVNDFPSAAVVIVKHGNPCGVASSTKDALAEVYRKALACDEKSAFGGVVAINRPVDKATAEAMSAIFLEVVIAEKFSDDAVQILSAKKNLRLIESAKPAQAQWEVRRSLGGYLIQNRDDRTWPSEIRTVTTTPLAEPQLNDLKFAWTVVKHVRSNAIVLARDGVTLGVGAGQMSRVDSVDNALRKAGKDRVQGAVLASDAFFPFRDSIDALKGLGLAAIVQPGGSQRDAEVIAACNEAGIAMVFTGERHFRH